MRITLALPGLSPSTTDKVEFYRAERDILSSIGPTTVEWSPWRAPTDADLVVSWWWARSLPAAAALRARRGPPVVVTGATDIGNPVGLPAGRVAAKNTLARACASLAAANLAISTSEERRMRRWRYPRLSTVPLALDLDFYSPGRGRARDPYMLLTILHLNHESVQRKGLWRAMDGLAKVKERRCQLVVVGSDQGALAAVRERAEHLGIDDRLVLTGGLPREEKRDLLRRAGAYVKLSSYEGFGYSVAEAMACGCPVIVSRGGALGETTGGAAYAYVDEGWELAGVIEGMAGDEAGLRAAAEAGLVHCREHFSHARRRLGLEEVFEAVMGNGSAPAVPPSGDG